MKIADEVNKTGMQLEPFKHTRRKVILDSKFNKLAQEEVKRVKLLTGNYLPWVVN